MHAGKPLDPTTGRGRGRERSTTEFGAQGEVLLRSTAAPFTPPQLQLPLSQRMILGVGHWQRLWPCSSLSDAAKNVRTCASRPSGIRATNRESGEWMSGGGQQLHASHRYNTASSVSSAASASPAAFRDGRTDRLLPCDISIGVCPGILSKLMPYHAGLFHEGVGLG